MGRAFGGGSSSFSSSYQFEIVSENESGNLLLEDEISRDNDSVGYFSNAIQDFEVFISFDSSGFPAANFETITTSGNPISTLDLIARRSASGIEYIFQGEELIQLGIIDYKLTVEDADGNDENGLQIVRDINDNFQITDSSADPGFQFSVTEENEEGQLVGKTITIDNLDTPEAINLLEDNGYELVTLDFEAAINNIEYIAGEDESLPESPFSFVSSITGDTIFGSGSIGTNDFIGFDPIIQAEDLDLTTYEIENFSEIETNDGSEPADTTGISLLDATDITGTARLTAGDFSIAPGTYDLTLSVFDENDGNAEIDVLLNGTSVFEGDDALTLVKETGETTSGSIMLTEDTSSGFPTEDVRREFVVQGIEITDPTDIISIEGTADGSEQARIDFISFSNNDL